jgi:hypothetical protein
MSAPVSLRFSEKWNTIFLPFVLIAVGFWLFYAVFHVVLYLKIEVNLVERDRFFIAYLLVWVFLILGVWPRVKKLEFQKEGAQYIYTALLSFLLLIPLRPLMFAVEKLAGKHVVLNTPEDYVHADFYTISKYYVAKENARFTSHTSTGGRFNNQLNIYAYAVMPILEDSLSSRGNAPVLWYGKVYRKTVKNKDTAGKVRDFMQQSVQNFSEEKALHFAELQRIGLNRGGNNYRKLLPPGAILFLDAEPLGDSLSNYALILLGVFSFHLLLLLGVKAHYRSEAL